MAFRSIADLVMLLRVYAMYNRSRILLGILIALYIPVVIVNLVRNSMYSYSTKLQVAIQEAPLGNEWICTETGSTEPPFIVYLTAVLQILLSALFCVLSIVQFARHSLEMHRVLGKWQWNRYMKLLVQESVVYFIVNLLDRVAMLLNYFVQWSPGAVASFAVAVFAFMPFILAPHLIISVRELHSRVVGQHIDSGFGLGSQLLSGNDIVFAGAEERIEEE
ncbi:hypothetical protein BU15DRAFT_74867 [Melanogaster broomeanus]|nr:hypothetical protein BU15DRAFT_74867 [Melanogaster broomeanus]